MPNHNPQGHNQYTNKNERANERSNLFAGERDRDGRHDNPGRPSKNETSDRSSSSRDDR